MRNPFAAAATRVQRRATATSPYAGASFNRLTYDFIMGSVSANQVLRWSGRVLRNRARELVMNNAHGSRVPQLFSENVIGENGITYQAAVRLGDGTYDKAVNRALEASWYRWCDRYASVDGQLSWPELETLLMESEPPDGEVIARLVENFDNPFRFAVEILDPDQLDTSIDRPAGDGRNGIEMGIEYDAWRRPVRYHLWSNHPSEGGRAGRIQVPAAQIVHTYLRRRPGQMRGVSWYAPLIIDLRMHGGYREAELFAARASANKMGFYELEENAEAIGDPDGDDADADKPHIPQDAEPGLLEQLPPGYRFKPYDPQHPTTAFKDFDDAVLHSLAVGFRVSHMSISGNLKGTSYGSGRIGLLGEQAVYRAMQKRHIQRHSTPVHRVWLRMALLSGQLQLPSFDAARYEAAIWHPRPFPWIDPEKDLNYRLGEVRAGVNSLTRIAAEQGRDIEEVFQERAFEIQLARKYGVPLDLMWGGHAQPGPGGESRDASRSADDDEEDRPRESDGDQASGITLPDSRRALAARQAPPVRLLRNGTTPGGS